MLNKHLYRGVPFYLLFLRVPDPRPFDLRDQKTRKNSLTSPAQYSHGRLLGFVLVVVSVSVVLSVSCGVVVPESDGVDGVAVTEVCPCRGRRSLPEGQMPLEAQEIPGPVGTLVDGVPGDSPVAKQPVEGHE